MVWQQLAVPVMFLPNKMCPRDVHFVEKLVKVLDEQASFWVVRFRTHKSPSSFGRQTIDQAAFGGRFALIYGPLHEQYFLYLSICLVTVLGKSKVLSWNIGMEVKVALVICNLPVWERRDEVASSLLSQFFNTTIKRIFSGGVKIYF